MPRRNRKGYSRSRRSSRPAATRDTTTGSAPGRPPLQSVRSGALPAGVSHPTREVVVDDTAWTIHQRGASRIGLQGAGPVAILSLGVEPVGESASPPGDLPTRYFVARSLDEVPEEELVAFIRACAPRTDP